MSWQNASWLLIGMGIGIMLGKEFSFEFFFGLFLLTLGFIINYISEKQIRNEKLK